MLLSSGRLLLLCSCFCSMIIWCIADCPSGVEYTEQPLSTLPCNPMDLPIRLTCAVESSISNIPSITWYHTMEPGEMALRVVTADVGPYTLTSSGFGGTDRSFLTFTVTDSTLGFYWCGVDGYSPSTFTPICPWSINPSIPVCTNIEFSTNESQCATTSSMLLHPDITEDCIPPEPISNSSSSSLMTDMTPTVSLSYTNNITPTSTDISSSFSIDSITAGVLQQQTISSTTLLSSQILMESSQPSSKQSVSIVLVSLISVCVLLGCIAAMIIIAISMLCYVTKKGNFKEANDVQGSISPTVDAISNGKHNEYVTSELDGSSFSNPVYEIAIYVPHPSKEPPPQLSLALPKIPPNTFSSTPPIFSDNDNTQANNVCEYAKPDMNKKRSRSGTTSSSQDVDTPPPQIPQYMNNPPLPQIPSYMNDRTKNRIEDVVYDMPTIAREEPLLVHNGVSDEPSNGVYSLADADYADPDENIVIPKIDPSYEDPWENLPSAIMRSRESTRSHSNQPANNGTVGNNNNNNTSSMFDDPAYDVPTV